MILRAKLTITTSTILILGFVFYISPEPLLNILFNQREKMSYLLAQNSYEIELLKLTNLERNKAGLPPLILSNQLTQAAKIHAEDIAKNQIFEHIGSDGSTPSDRAKAVGYPYSYVGENIAAGRATPKETIEAWMKDSRHRSNILNPEYTDVGLAYVNAPKTNYIHYWVQVFGKSSPDSNYPNTSRELGGKDCKGDNILSATNCVDDSLNNEETRLYQMINNYRLQQGLSSIPISVSLSRVANRHLRDLRYNSQQYDRSGKYWRFGWSNCAYDANNPQTFSCMWNAPKRLNTSYLGKGYELLCGGVGEISAQIALQCWRKSVDNNQVILNQGNWRNYQWRAMGIAIFEGYASVWLGQDLESGNPSPNPSPRIW